MTSRQCWFALSVVVLVLSTITIVLTQTADNYGNNKLKLLIDTDAGTDDAFALFYFLRAEKIAKFHNRTDGPEILGITCVNGNTEVYNVVVNVLKVLQTADRLDIPVYIGAGESLLKTPHNSYYFGKDGMGDVPTSSPPSPDLAQSEHAVNALIRLVDENPGEITLVALGPLTNIAMAIRMDKMFLMKLKKLVILGGSAEGAGNVIPGVEFNFYMDPEANYAVLNDSKFTDHSILLLPIEPVMRMMVSMEWRKEILGDLEASEILFMNKVEHIENYPDEGMWRFYDLVTAAITLNESMITKLESYGVEAITQGATRGGITVDYSNLIKSQKTIDIVYGVDVESYKDSLINFFV